MAKTYKFTINDIEWAMNQAGGVYTKAAKLLGVSRRSVSRWVKEYAALKEDCKIQSDLVRDEKFDYDNWEYTDVDNSRILIISDMHIPYHHRDMMDFLRAVNLKYRPTRVLSIGDEGDFHSMSFHTSDPDLDSPGTELSKARAVMKELEVLFPKMDIMHSNHGSMLYRRGKEHGIPKYMLKSYNEVLGVGEGWVWHEDLTLKLPNGQYVNFHHGRGSNVKLVSQKMGMSFVQGHYHSQFRLDYWGNPLQLNFAMNVGCLIDDHSLAFAYNKIPAERPIIGLGMIIDSHPKLIPLVKDIHGRWTGELN